MHLTEDGVVISNFSHSNNRTEFEFFNNRYLIRFLNLLIYKWEEKKFIIDNPEGKPKALHSTKIENYKGICKSAVISLFTK